MSECIHESVAWVTGLAGQTWKCLACGAEFAPVEPDPDTSTLRARYRTLQAASRPRSIPVPAWGASMTDRKLDPKIEAVVDQCEAAISETLSAMPHVSHISEAVPGLAAEIVEHFKAALAEAGAVVLVPGGGGGLNDQKLTRGHLREMGRLTSEDGHEYPFAILVEFDSVEEFKQAMKDEAVRLAWGEVSDDS